VQTDVTDQVLIGNSAFVRNWWEIGSI